MILRRGETVGYDRDRMFYRFTMLDEDRVVLFEVSNAALSDLGKRWIARSGLDLDMVFVDHRDLIEEVGTRLYVAGRDSPQPIKIFAKHLLPLVSAKRGKRTREADPQF